MDDQIQTLRFRMELLTESIGALSDEHAARPDARHSDWHRAQAAAYAHAAEWIRQELAKGLWPAQEGRGLPDEGPPNPRDPGCF